MSISLTAAKTGTQETKNLLTGVNVKTSLVEVGNSEYEELIPDDSINITVGMFFDGTGNNRENTESRLLDEKKQNALNNGEKSPLTPGEEKKASKYRAESWIPFNDEQVKKHSDSSSYENDYSNVSRLEEYYDEDRDIEKHKYAKVYIEGIGTGNGGSDGVVGSATGLDAILAKGINGKVRKGCRVLAKKKILKHNVKKINTLIVDAYGFSRGAAAARHFLSVISKKKGDLKKFEIKDEDKEYYDVDYGYLGELLGDKVTIRKIVIRFVGLYDCVASHGLVQFNDKWDLGLDIVKKANHVFHIGARDEHRFKFSLTNIDSAGSKGLEKFIPGVHSDIGGCYVDGKGEENIWLNHAYTSFEDDKYYLMEQGWYTYEELSVEKKWVLQGKPPGYKDVLIGNRTSISNKYSFITLSFMAKYAISKGVEFKPLSEIETAYDIGTDQNAKYPCVLQDAKERLKKYVFGDAPELTIYNSESDYKLLRELRNKYFHFSSDYGEVGMFPEWKGKYRARTIYSDTGIFGKKKPLHYRKFDRRIKIDLSDKSWRKNEIENTLKKKDGIRDVIPKNINKSRSINSNQNSLKL